VALPEQAAGLRLPEADPLLRAAALAAAEDVAAALAAAADVAAALAVAAAVTWVAAAAMAVAVTGKSLRLLLKGSSASAGGPFRWVGQTRLRVLGSTVSRQHRNCDCETV
jgi:amino acid transporter